MLSQNVTNPPVLCTPLGNVSQTQFYYKILMNDGSSGLRDSRCSFFYGGVISRAIGT